MRTSHITRRFRAARAFRLLALVCALVAVAVLTPGRTARAATASLQVTPAVGPPTTSVRVAGAGFAARERVALRFDGVTLTTVNAGTAGGFTAAIAVPTSARPGAHTIRATGASSGRSASAAFLVRTDWPQFRDGPRHQGYNRYENILTPTTAGTLHRLWTAAGGIPPYSPAVAAGSVYAAGFGTLEALNPATGVRRWSVAVPQDATFPGSCASYSWAIASSPAVDANRVVIGSTDGRVRAYGAAHGALLWAAPTGSPIYASPTVAGGVVYVASDNGYLYALNSATGARKWRTLVSTTGVDSSAAVSGGTVYVNGCDGRLYAISAATGDPRWSQAVSGWPMGSSPAVVDGVVYDNSDDGLAALDAATGAILWQHAYGEVQVSSPAVAEGVVYIGTGGYAGGGNYYGGVVAYDAKTGAQKWESIFGWDYVTASPAVANGVVYVTCEDGHLVALNAATGAVLRRIALHVQADSSPAVSDGRVFVSDRTTWTNGVTHAFGP